MASGSVASVDLAIPEATVIDTKRVPVVTANMKFVQIVQHGEGVEMLIVKGNTGMRILLDEYNPKRSTLMRRILLLPNPH